LQFGEDSSTISCARDAGPGVRGEDLRMPSDMRASEPAEASWAPLGWFTLVVLGAAATWALCLPVVPATVGHPPSVQSVFHIEWFLAAAALSVFIWHTARLSWILGIVSIVITSAQVFCIADDGAVRLQQAGVVPALTDLLYIVAFLEIALFTGVGVSGIVRNLADRRWARLVAQLAALDAPSKKHHH
jgi:hypothetical protein